MKNTKAYILVLCLVLLFCAMPWKKIAKAGRQPAAVSKSASADQGKNSGSSDSSGSSGSSGGSANNASTPASRERVTIVKDLDPRHRDPPGGLRQTERRQLPAHVLHRGDPGDAAGKSGRQPDKQLTGAVGQDFWSPCFPRCGLGLLRSCQASLQRLPIRVICYLPPACEHRLSAALQDVLCAERHVQHV